MELKQAKKCGEIKLTIDAFTFEWTFHINSSQKH